jgi:recombination protein RecT
MNQQQPQTAALAKPVLEVIEKGKQGFFDRLPKDIDRERLWLGLVTLIQKRPDIAECDPKSIIIAGYEAAELGINLNPALGLGYVIPYKGIAQFQLGYRGMIQKAYEMGVAKLIFAEVVYEKDQFRRVLAPMRTLEHVPPALSADRGAAIGSYSFIELRDGAVDFEVMTKEQIQRHQAHSKYPDSLMWKTFWEEAWRKTPLRIHFKRIPLSSAGIEKFAELIFKDAEKDFDFDIPDTNAPLAEIRRAPAPSTMISAESVPNSSPAPSVPSQPPTEMHAKGRGKGKRPSEAESAPERPAEPKAAEAESAASAMPSPQDVEKFWRTAYGYGWGAYEVKKFLEKKGIPEGAIKNCPIDRIPALLQEMEAGE